MQNGGPDVEVPTPGDETVGLLLLLGAHAHADVTLLSQLARILKHMILRSSFLLCSPPTIPQGRHHIELVRCCPLSVISNIPLREVGV